MIVLNKLIRGKKVLTEVLIMLLLIVEIAGGYIIYQLNKIKTVQLSKDDSSLGISDDIQEGSGGTTSSGDVSASDNDSEKSENSGSTAKNEKKQVTNILLLGEDAYSNEAGRSDAIMVLSIDGRNKKVRLVSIMRDIYVSVEGHGNTKINHAYAYGGPPLSIKTVNQNFLLDIRDYIKVDFSGLEKVVDLMGGVEVTIKDYEVKAMTSKGITAPGDYNLNGAQALAYSRIRYYGNNDFERTERHRTIMSKLLEKINARGPGEFPAIVSAILPYVETSMDKTQIIDMGIKTLSLGMNGIEKTRIPYDGHYTDINNGIYYLGWEKDYTITQLHNFLWGQ